MKNQISAKTKLAIAFIPLAFVAFVVLAAPKTILNKTEMVSSAAILADSASNYAKYCSRCHGGDGRAQTAKGKQTNATDLTKSRIGDAAGIKIISKGKELMPGFSGNMSADEIKQLMGYIRGFRQ